MTQTMKRSHDQDNTPSQKFRERGCEDCEAGTPHSQSVHRRNLGWERPVTDDDEEEYYG